MRGAERRRQRVENGDGDAGLSQAGLTNARTGTERTPRVCLTY